MAGEELGYLERKERIANIMELMQNDNWTAVLKYFQGEEEYHEPLLVWVRPTLECLKFIKEELVKLDIDTISSVGCGCGFLEWLLIKATGLKVIGYEVNKGWWESPHATPHYIHLEYLDPSLDAETVKQTSYLSGSNAAKLMSSSSSETAYQETSASGGSCTIPQDTAIMFNYFNNNKYFIEYLQQYQGKCVILIGPINGNHHCDPEPGFLEDHPDWRLQASYDLHGEDAIAIYARRRPWALVKQ